MIKFATRILAALLIPSLALDPSLAVLAAPAQRIGLKPAIDPSLFERSALQEAGLWDMLSWQRKPASGERREAKRRYHLTRIPSVRHTDRGAYSRWGLDEARVGRDLLNSGLRPVPGTQRQSRPKEPPRPGRSVSSGSAPHLDSAPKFFKAVRSDLETQIAYARKARGNPGTAEAVRLRMAEAKKMFFEYRSKPWFSRLPAHLRNHLEQIEDDAQVIVENSFSAYADLLVEPPEPIDQIIGKLTYMRTTLDKFLVELHAVRPKTGGAWWPYEGYVPWAAWETLFSFFVLTAIPAQLFYEAGLKDFSLVTWLSFPLNFYALHYFKNPEALDSPIVVRLTQFKWAITAAAIAITVVWGDAPFEIVRILIAPVFLLTVMHHHQQQKLVLWKGSPEMDPEKPILKSIFNHSEAVLEDRLDRLQAFLNHEKNMGRTQPWEISLSLRPFFSKKKRAEDVVRDFDPDLRRVKAAALVALELSLRHENENDVSWISRYLLNPEQDPEQYLRSNPYPFHNSRSQRGSEPLRLLRRALFEYTALLEQLQPLPDPRNGLHLVGGNSAHAVSSEHSRYSIHPKAVRLGSAA